MISNFIERLAVVLSSQKNTALGNLQYERTCFLIKNKSFPAEEILLTLYKGFKILVVCSTYIVGYPCLVHRSFVMCGIFFKLSTIIFFFNNVS